MNPSNSQDLKRIFDLFLDVETDIQRREFSIIHQCVLGLNHLGLEQYLHLTTADINSQCSSGRPPLFWAASSSNLSAYTTLLKYGARTDIRDSKGQNILHRAAAASDINVARKILETIFRRDKSLCSYHLENQSDEMPFTCAECHLKNHPFWTS